LRVPRLPSPFRAGEVAPEQGTDQYDEQQAQECSSAQQHARGLEVLLELLRASSRRAVSASQSSRN
jgi:hypothetical protein